MTDEEINRRFDYHPPRDALVADAHVDVREYCKDLAIELNEILPEGYEKDIAIHHLEEVLMWSNAAIAREGK